MWFEWSFQFREEDIRKIIDEEMIKEFTGLKDDGLEFAKSKAMDFADSFLEARVIFNGYAFLLWDFYISITVESYIYIFLAKNINAHTCSLKLQKLC